jgi:hypothetical protein
MDLTHSNKDIGTTEKRIPLAANAASRQMRLAPKRATATWWNGSFDPSFSPTDVDHFVALDNVVLTDRVGGNEVASAGGRIIRRRTNLTGSTPAPTTVCPFWDRWSRLTTTAAVVRERARGTLVPFRDPPTRWCRPAGATGQRRPLTGSLALDGPVDRRASDAEQVAELGGAVFAGPVQGHQVGFLAHAELGLLAPQAALGRGAPAKLRSSAALSSESALTTSAPSAASPRARAPFGSRVRARTRHPLSRRRRLTALPWRPVEPTTPIVLPSGSMLTVYRRPVSRCSTLR